MSEPPRLFPWSVDENYQFTHMNMVNILSSSCYISGAGGYVFSAGGPATSIRAIREDGGLGEQIEELYSVLDEEILNVYKTRAAVKCEVDILIGATQSSRDGKYLFTSTRGWNNTEVRGWAVAFELNHRGYLEQEDVVAFYEAPVTLGSAGGLWVVFWEDETKGDPRGLMDHMYLNDTSEGWVYVLGWTPSNHSLEVVATLRYPDNATPYEAVRLD